MSMLASNPSSPADVPNPFAIALPAKTGTKQRFLHALQFLAIAALITVIWMAATVYGKQYLLSRLTDGFDALDTTQKNERLLQIAGFGSSAIPHLTNCLLDEDDAVSEVAFGLLTQLQNDWTTYAPASSAESHASFLDAMQDNVASTPLEQWTDRQIARSRALIRQSMLEFADTKSFGVNELGEETQTLIASVSKRSRDLLNDLAPAPRMLTKTAVAKVAANAAPSKSTQTESMWTDWPPSRPVEIVRSGTRQQPEAIQVRETATRLDVDNENADQVSQSDTVNQLETVPQGVTVPLSQVSPSTPSVHRVPGLPRIAETGTHRVVRVNAELSPSPFRAMNDETVIRHLGNPDAMLANQARVELTQRGFSNAQLEFGSALAIAKPADRIELIDSMRRSGGLNAWPWLSMSLDDADRQVRLHVVSILASSPTETTQKRLQKRLEVETDPQVATRIRRVLDLR
ncbi:hypothetical protein LOC71_01580 [Rhodopirellula sp. JC740]|uniref:Transmembrane protein n=1 Tax=Rhodopirellula halodulae TaxID=2894198 RepID=A0ABS8NER9_9BACT|nr:hypothetical protein [Rhodopirellula sp. JC740]MCC9640946.1 hypothetical protein [Rhodopirellula sp. JC740]